MPPAKSTQSEDPPVHALSRNKRRRVHKKAKREREQLLLVLAAAVAELAEQERHRVIADRDARRDRAAALACADRERIREGGPSSLCTPPAVDDAVDVAALAVRTLREAREQSAMEQRVLSRLAANLERAQRRQSPAPAPSSAPPVALQLPAPVPGVTLAVPGPGPSSPSSAPHTTLENKNAELDRVVVSFEAACAEQGRRPCSSGSPARPTARSPADPARPLRPSGSTVARALAEKDARIAQLLFELKDRDARQLGNSLGRAAAFLRDPSNLLAAPPPEEPASEPVRYGSFVRFPTPGTGWRGRRMGELLTATLPLTGGFGGYKRRGLISERENFSIE
jgi:hypothetical protein